jgi:hypothetical protein
VQIFLYWNIYTMCYSKLRDPSLEKKNEGYFSVASELYVHLFGERKEGYIHQSCIELFLILRKMRLNNRE